MVKEYTWRPKTQGIEEAIDWWHWRQGQRIEDPGREEPNWLERAFSSPVTGPQIQQFMQALELPRELLGKPFAAAATAPSRGQYTWESAPSEYLRGGEQFEAYEQQDLPWGAKGALEELPLIPAYLMGAGAARGPAKSLYEAGIKRATEATWKKLGTKAERAAHEAALLTSKGKFPAQIPAEEEFVKQLYGTVNVALQAQLVEQAARLGGTAAVKTAISHIPKIAQKELATLGYTIDDMVKMSAKEAKELAARNVKPTRPEARELATAPQALLPEKTITKDYQQLVYAHQLAREKGLLTPTGKPMQNYRKIALNVTGKKSMKDMDRYEAEAFIDALENAVAKGGTVSIPKTRAIVPQSLLEKIPMLREVGYKERYRQMPYVMRKIGLYEEFWPAIQGAEVLRIEELASFRTGLNKLHRTIGKDPIRKARIFNALEEPLQTHALDPAEQEAYTYFRKFFDGWADRLKLPATQRRQNYVTHIFEEAIEQDMKANHPLDPELIRALDFNYAKRTFNPFLKPRMGENTGLKLDPFAAAEAYEQYALRQFYYQPLVKKMGAFEKIITENAGPNAGRQWRAMINRLAGRPDWMDNEVNYSLKEFADKVSAMPPIKKLLGDRLVNLMQTTKNPSALITHQYASLLYQAFLGYRPVSAIRNLSQQILAVSEVGPLTFAEGLGMRATKAGKAALDQSLVLRSRQVGYLPGVEQDLLGRLTGKLQEKALWMFKAADKENVKNSFLAGYAEAKRLAPWAGEKFWIQRGDEVAMKTQYLYTRMARSLFEQSAVGGFLSPFTSWPRNFTELFTSWVKGTESMVYKQIATETGKKVPTSAIPRKQLMTYLSLLIAAGTVEQTTDIRALEYTGWTSFKTLARLSGGDVPSLQIVGGLAQIVAGAAAGDEAMVKEGVYKVRPDRLIGIIRQLEDISTGKRTPIDLFIYRQLKKAEEMTRAEERKAGGARTRERTQRER